MTVPVLILVTRASSDCGCTLRRPRSVPSLIRLSVHSLVNTIPLKPADVLFIGVRPVTYQWQKLEREKFLPAARARSAKSGTT